VLELLGITLRRWLIGQSIVRRQMI
jgi:hypothetical protein